MNPMWTWGWMCSPPPASANSSAPAYGRMQSLSVPMPTDPT